MSQWNTLAHFMYGQGFWYATPEREVGGLSEDQLFWVPGPSNLPIIWQVGHIAHRERCHVGYLLQGLLEPLNPPEFDIFGDTWYSAEELRSMIPSVDQVLAWVKDVRAQSHANIDTLHDDDFAKPAPCSNDGLTIGHWLFITTAHTALHVGRIQLLRAMLEGKHENAC